MRMFAQDRAFYRRIRVDGTEHPEALRRLELLERVSLARRKGLGVADALDVAGLPRSTYYDWRRRHRRDGLRGLAPRSSRPLTHPGRRWTHADARRVFAIRGEMRWCGKARLHWEHSLRHPDRPLSLAAVGRIVQWGLESGRIKPGGIGEANPCSFWCEGRAKAKRRRDFSDGHAERWGKEDKHKGIQMDHMTLTVDGRTFKEFRAVCPKTRRQHAKVFSRATAGTAKAFLAEALKRLGEQPIQVDGGSEFRAEFEDECAERRLPLKVLPPRRPELNGIVERANRTARIEFWSHYDGELTCQAINRGLDPHLDYYNNRRPHRALGMKTPADAARMLGLAA